MAKQAGHEDDAMKKELKISNSVLQLQCYRTNFNIIFQFPLKQYIKLCTCMDSKLEVFVRTGKTLEKLQNTTYNLFLDSENRDFQRSSACLGVFAW